MKLAVKFGILFLVGYVVQTGVVGHQRFPGDDWVRQVFVWVLFTHTFLAVLVVPMIIRMLVLARRENWTKHRALAKWTFPIWVYVTFTGLFIYVMNNFVRPI